MTSLQFDGRILEGKNISKRLQSLIDETDFSGKCTSASDFLCHDDNKQTHGYVKNHIPKKIRKR